jgi:hypothetical protein
MRAKQQKQPNSEGRVNLQAGEDTVSWEASLGGTDIRPPLRRNRLLRCQVTSCRLRKSAKKFRLSLTVEDRNSLRWTPLM